MVAKKDLMIVALATFCLTATVFMVVPTKSQNERYDPWADYDENGTVNIVDIANVAKAFGASGDPTRNVYVTNPNPYDADAIRFNMSWSNQAGSHRWIYSPAGYGFTEGYSRLFIHLNVLNIDPPIGFGAGTTVYVSGIAWNSSGTLSSYEWIDVSRCNVTISLLFPLMGYTTVGEFEIKAETINWIDFSVTSSLESGSLQLQVCTYMRND